MNTLMRRDQSELRYNSILLLSKQGNPNYYAQFFRNVKGFFYGMGRQDLVEILDIIIYEKIERVMGTKMQMVLIVFKNLPAHNSHTHSKNPIYRDIPIYKYTIESWLDEIETWCMQQLVELEKSIRFLTPARQWI